MCRQKTYYGIFCECSLIDKYIPYACFANKRNFKKVEDLEDVLKPVLWTFTINHSYKDYENVKLIMPRQFGKVALYTENRIKD
jgi:hypothetical protein